LSGIAIFDGTSWETITSQNSIITSHVNEVVFDDDNTAYVGTINGLFKINGGDISILLDSSSLEPNFINVRCLGFKGDSLCIGTVNGGLGYLYSGNISWYNSANGLIDNTSTDLIIDSQNLWITAPYGGLISHLTTGSFINFNTGFFSDWPSNSLNTLYKDNNENLFYIGSSGGGFFSFSYEFGIQSTNTFNTQNSGLINDYVLCIAKENSGYWIGTEGGLTYWSMITDINALGFNNDASYFNVYNGKLTFNNKGKVNIYSLDGKRVFSADNESEINLSFLNKGCYISEFNNKRSIFILN
jgi:ligand-binding sensor domain-containing protein